MGRYQKRRECIFILRPHSIPQTEMEQAETVEKRCQKTKFWPREKPYKPPKTAKQVAFRWLRDAEAAGSSPVTSAKNPNLTFRSGLDFLFCLIRTWTWKGLKRKKQSGGLFLARSVRRVLSTLSTVAERISMQGGTPQQTASPVTSTKIGNPLMKIGGFLILYYSFFIIRYSLFIKNGFP